MREESQRLIAQAVELEVAAERERCAALVREAAEQALADGLQGDTWCPPEMIDLLYSLERQILITSEKEEQSR